jgi:hypothetical protein
MRLTKRGERVLGAAFVVGLLAAIGFAGHIETMQPQTIATDSECDAIYHAVYILDGNPARIDLIHTAFDLGCPFEDSEGNYIYTWEPTN